MTINARLDAVFVHVTDMPRAIAWYCRLLDLPTPVTTHEDMICDLDIAGETGIMLDAYPKPVAPKGTGPRLMFATHDLAAAHELAQSLSDTVSDVQDIGSAVVFYVEDPDHNQICIIQRKS